MRKINLWLICVVVLAFNFQPSTFNLSFAQEKPFWSDDFTKGTKDWEIFSGDWKMGGNKCTIAEPEAALCVSGKAPDLQEQVLEIKITEKERLSEGGWSVAGMVLLISDNTFFLLAFTEGPGKEHYIDFLENYEGKWQAQQEGDTKLKIALDDNMGLKWEYNKEYKLRMELDKEGITGYVIDPQNDKILSKRRYIFGDVSAVRNGRFGLITRGASVSYRNATVYKTIPTAPSPAAVTEKEPVEKEEVVAKKSTERIAIFKEPAFSVDSSLADSLKKSLEQSGINSQFINGDELCDASLFNRANFDLVIYTSGKNYPALAAKNIESFLNKGGDLIVLGGPPFSNPFWKKDGWVDSEGFLNILAKIKPENMLFDFESGNVSDWARATNDPGSPSSFEITSGGPGNSRGCLLVDIPNLTGWDTWKHSIEIPAGNKLFCFWAKADGSTPQISIELDENDGSRWIATTRISTKWQPYSLPPEEFKYWKDNPSKGRGGAGDTVKLENVNSIAIGLAFSHTQVGPGEHKFWMDEIGASSNPLGKFLQVKEMTLDGLCPAYKMFPVTNLTTAKVYSNQVFLKDAVIPQITEVFSCSPRPQGTGFAKKRKMRFVPLINAYDKNGKRCGYIGWMFINGGSYKQSSWVCFGVNNPVFYKDPTVSKMLVDLVKKMTDGIYLYEGGSQYYAYFQGESVKFGAQVANFGQEESPSLSVLIKVKPRGKDEIVFQKELNISVPAGQSQSIDCLWEPGKFADKLYDVSVELLRNGQVIDSVKHELQAWEPKPLEKRNYMTIKDGDFYLKGDKWFAHGVNYMPSSGIATEDGDYFEQYMSARSYDPDVFEEDLSRIKDVGMNMVSIFVYHPHHRAHNILDFLMRCEKYGIMVNLSLRPNADPLMFKWKEVKSMIEEVRCAEHDVLFAYDLAWERTWGNYEPSYGNVKGRKGYDKEWGKWIIERYGSLEDAERDWEFPCPRQGKKITGPSDQQLRDEGEWNRMVAAYRRFVDDFVSKKHTIAVRLIKSVDPYHLISFRMGHSGDPTCGPEAYGYDFKAFKSLDIMEPEGYGRIGDWDRVRDGAFTATYSRYAAPGKPVLWAEFGNTTWQGTNFNISPRPEEGKGKFYDDFYKMILLSYSSGTSCWWYPGGFRVGENSDFGIINPDGSWRPVTDVIKKYSPKIITSHPMPKVDQWFVVDRDASVRGMNGIYEKIKDEYLRAIESGRFPGLKDEGMGTNSLNTPLVAVGNTKYNGNNPPKYLNAEFNYVKIKCGVEPSLSANALVAGGSSAEWQEINNGDRVEVPASTPILYQVSAGNLQVATWICPANAKGTKGAVYLSTPKESELQVKVEIPKDVPYLADADISEFVLSKGISKETKVILQMTALDRMWFGEKLEFTLIPK